jgi:hypothetical protein
MTGDATGVPGQDRAFAISATDPSAADTAAGFTFNVAWGDGSGQTVFPGQSLALTHAFAQPGAYAVSVTATDRTGAVSGPAVHTVAITPVALQPDVCDPLKTNLVVGGTQGDDRIGFERVGSTGQVRVVVNGTAFGPFAPDSRVVAFGQGGNDELTVGNVPLSGWLFGGAGRDTLGATVFADASHDRIAGQDDNCWYFMDLDGVGPPDEHDFGGVDVIEDVDPVGAVRVGPVAAYNFDAGSGAVLADVTGNGHDGAIAGAAWVGGGHTGGALSFDGTDDWVTAADAAGLDLTTGMTLEAWVKPAAVGGWQTVLLKEGEDLPHGLSYALYGNDPTVNRPAAFVNTGGPDLPAAGTAKLAANTWTHLAATCDGLTLRLYANGVEVRSKPATEPLRQTGHPLRIGGNAVWGEYFSGLTDDVRVYDRALTGAEVARDMATPVGPTAGGVTFFVADPAAGAGFRYGPGGAAVGSYALGVSDPVGVASVAAGLTQWVVGGVTHRVSVVGPDGSARGSWLAEGLTAPADVAVDGPDVWVVDVGAGRVVRYSGAARLVNGAESPAESFGLHADNASPTGVVTDGLRVWVTDDGRDEVFVYGTEGALIGRWGLDGANADASAATRDPTGASADLWVADRVDGRVFRYDGGTGWWEGTKTAADSFTLAAGNTRPEGIADPPPTLLGPTPCLSFADSPFRGSSFSHFYLEDAEDGLLDTPGVTAVNNSGGSPIGVYAPSATTDSVDGDDGFINGSGVKGRSFGPVANDGGENHGTTLDFDRDALGSLPTHAGVVWTDGSQTASTQFEAFGSAGESLGVVGRVKIGDSSFSGGTAEDRFFGVVSLAGISKITVRDPGGLNTLELDHLQYGVLRQPSISIVSPSSDISATAGTTRLVTGRATDPVTVDGTPVDVFDASGSFFTRVQVRSGRNTFTFSTADRFGQNATATFTVDGTQAAPGEIDFSLLSDVSGSLVGEYGRTRCHVESRVLYADLAVRSAGQYAAGAPPFVGVTTISDPAVRVRDADGVTPDGIPYFDFSALAAGGVLEPGGATGSRTVAFYNPSGERFTYEFVILGRLNRAPAIDSVPDVVALAGQVYRYAVAATDPDGDAVTYSLVAAPDGMAIDPATGVITWPRSGHDFSTSTHAVTVRVEDGRGGSAEQRYTLSAVFRLPNRPPVFTSIPVVDAIAGRQYAYDAETRDEDGHPPFYSLLSGPAGMTVDPTSGFVTWTPTPAQLGSHPVALRVRDGNGGFALRSFTVQVIAPNVHPVITSTPPTPAAVGLPYRYEVRAQDGNADPLTYRLDAAPAGMTIDPDTGLITWTPADGQQFDPHPVVVVAADPAGAADSQSFTLAARTDAPPSSPLPRSPRPPRGHRTGTTSGRPTRTATASRTNSSPAPPG